MVDWEWAQYWGVGHRIPLSYPAVVKKLGDVADFVKSMIVFLENYGMDLQSTTVVGHSLGAHVAGIAGYGLVRKLNYLVGESVLQKKEKKKKKLLVTWVERRAGSGEAIVIGKGPRRATVEGVSHPRRGHPHGDDELWSE